MTTGASAGHLPSELHPVRTDESVARYVRSIAGRWPYLWHVPRYELAAQQSNTALGSLWHLLNPLMLVGFYFIIFDRLLDVSRGSDNYIAFLTIGVFVFQFSQRAVLGGATSVIGNVGLIRSIQFPRAILPLSVAMKQAYIHIPGVATMCAIAIATGESITALWLLLPIVFVAQLLMNAGLAMISARLTHSIPDVQNVIPIVFRFLFYGSGVLFSVELRTHGEWPWLFRLNPFYDIIEINRAILMGNDLHPSIPFIFIGWMLVLSIGGLFYFHHDEAFYGARN